MINRMLACFILLISLSNFHTQNLNKDIVIDPKLQLVITRLDQLMQTNDREITTLLQADVSFGHSNGWIQNFDDFKKDIELKKVHYQEIMQVDLKEVKTYKNLTSVRRVVHVKGQYKTVNFEMDLTLLEVWLRKNNIWKLWSRQSIELKP